MKTKSEQTIAWWDPYATSTPLKKLPNQLCVRSDLQKQLAFRSDSENVLENFQNAYGIPDFRRDKSMGANHQISNRSDKNKLSTHFDICSSSDDDTSEIQKRPIIRVSSKKNSKVLLNTKEDDTAESSLKQSRKPRKNISIKSSKLNIQTIQIPKGSKQITQTKKNKITSNHESTDRDCNEENINHNKTKTTRKKTVEGAKLKLKSKENSSCELQNYLDRHPSSFNEIEIEKLQKVRKAILQAKPTEKNTDDNSCDLKASEIENKLSSPQKKKIKKISNTSPLKKRIKKTNSKKMRTCTLKQMVSAVNVSASQNKSNLSHQLFSESAGQEYINILDLTSDEVKETAVKMKNSVPEKNSSACEPFKWPNPLNQNQNHQSSNKEGRPKRKKKAPKEFWLPDEKPSKIKPIISTDQNGNGKESSVVSECQDAGLRTNFKESFKETNTNICEGGNSHTQKNQNNKKETAVNEDDRKPEKKSEVLANNALNCSHTEVNISIQRDAVKCEDKNVLNSSEKSEFKKSEELSFNWTESGCSVVQCWKINKLKTGVFKLKVKAKFKCKTLHSNYMGGVLVKGCIKMKIGSKEENLKEGDMALVPPMTEWQATNTGECESVFYYWCGRFGK